MAPDPAACPSRPKPERRVHASGKHVATFTVATNEYRAKGQERSEYHAVATWD